MSIASRIETIEEHIGNVYDTLELGGADLTNVDKNIINIDVEWKNRLKDYLANGIEVIWDNWEKVVGEGTQLSLSPTIKGKMKVDLKGNTYQYTTTGKNLWGGFTYTSTSGGLTFTQNNDGSITASGTQSGTATSITVSDAISNGITKKLQAGTYTISGGGSNYAIQIYDTSSTLITSLSERTESGAFTLTEQKTIVIRIRKASATGQVNINAKIMLEKSNEPTTYEPYTNGASPNPSYPQDIQIVSGDNTIKVEGKNLFDVNGTYTGNNTGHINIENNNITINDTTGWGGTYCLFDKSYNYGDNYIVSFVQGEVSMNVLYKYFDSNGNSITTGGRGTYNSYYGGFLSELNNFVPYCPNAVSFKIGLAGKGSQVSSISNIQLELNNQATPYTPYQSASYEIDLRTSKNLFDISTITENIYIDENGNTGSSQVTNLSDYIEVDSSTQYTLSYTYTTLLNLNQRNICYYDENKTFISGGITYPPTNISTNFTTTATTKYIRFSYDKNCNSIMINEGSTAQPYEPYNSIELCKIGDYQDSIKKSTGKNLFDKDNINIITNKYLNSSGVETSDSSFSISDYIKVDENMTYSSQPFENKSACICFYDSNKTFLSSIALTQVDPNFITPNNCKYIRLSIWKANIDIIQIEKGNQITTYEPYGTDWYLHKETNKIILDGSEESWRRDDVYQGITQFSIPASNVLYINDSKIRILSNYFNGVPYSNSWIKDSVVTTIYDSRLRFMTSLYPDVDTFKTWLSTNNVIAYYVLATPTNTKIIDNVLIEQLNTLEKAYSYNEQTNISQANNNKPFILNVTALKEIAATTPLTSLSMSRVLPISNDTSPAELNEEDTEVNTEPIEENEENTIEEEIISETEEVNER